MVRILSVFLLLAASALAAAFRLYLTDGTFHMVREYEVQDGRVRFYSVERSEWEEMPASLADLKRTEAERQEHQRELDKAAAETAAEEKFDHQQAEERDKVPDAPGVYFLEGAAMKTVKLAEVKAVNNKGRNVLKFLTPIPLIPGKTLIEVDGEHSATVITAARPEFYFRLQNDERFGIVKMMPKKGVRVVQEWQIEPVVKQVVEKQQEVAIFRKQVENGLYKIWPEKPLEPGEYAVIEYMPGERNIETWDFAVSAR